MSWVLHSNLRRTRTLVLVSGDSSCMECRDTRFEWKYCSLSLSVYSYCRNNTRLALDALWLMWSVGVKASKRPLCRVLIEQHEADTWRPSLQPPAAPLDYCTRHFVAPVVDTLTQHADVNFWGSQKGHLTRLKLEKYQRNGFKRLSEAANWGK